MFLYHGTSSRFLSSILEKGLIVRKEKESNWKEDSSLKDRVYLTNAYAAYYGVAAIKEINKEDILIIEIDICKLDKNKFYPDEDFLILADCIKNDFSSKQVDIFQSLYLESLKYLGNCSYKENIPVEAITKISKFKYKECDLLTNRILDPMINLINYQFCGEMYKNLTQLLIGNKKSLKDISNIGWVEFLSKEDLIKAEKKFEEEIKHIKIVYSSSNSDK